MIIERDVDCGALYEQTRQGLLELVGSASDEELATRVPATPAWSVQDVVAHVIGIAADLNAGRFPTAEPDTWTAEQVEHRRGRSIEELRAEWDAEAPPFEHGLRLFGYEMGSHFLGDLLQHVADVGHALGQPLIADDETLLVALDHYMNAFHEALVPAGVGAVLVTIDGHEWVLGAGAVAATWTIGRYEGFRALGGRRDETQIRSTTWTGDVDGVIGLVSAYGLPAEGIVER